MAIYLGTNELGGGGGGSTPIGGFSFFIPPPGTGDLYTDDNSVVWLRSGAQLTSDGTGANDASIYRDSQDTIAITNPLVQTGSANARPDRHSVSYNGRNIVVIGYYQAGNTPAIQLFNPTTGASVSEATNVGSTNGGAYAAYTDTHTFMSRGTSGSTQANWANDDLSYIPTADLQTTSDIIYGYVGSTQGNITSNVHYNAPHSGAPFTVTNPGGTNERFWQLNASGGSTINEYTFDDTSASGTNPFTATGYSITLPTAHAGSSSNPISLAADGNLLYVHSNAALLEYNSTTRALVKTISGVPTGAGLSNSTTLRAQAFALVPNSRTTDSNRALWFSSNPSTSSTNSQVNVSKYLETEILTSVYDGNSSYDPGAGTGTRDAITLGDASDNAAHYGQSTTDVIYMWQRIA